MQSSFLAVPGWLNLAVCAAAACNQSTRISAPAPPRELNDPAEASAASTRGVIVAPLSVHLPSAMAALDRIIPHRIGDLNAPQPLALGRDRQGSFAFEVRREPFQVLRVHGDTLDLAAVLHYRGRAWIGSGLGDLGGSCGVEKDPPRARVVLRVVPYITKDWRLGVRSQIAQLAALSDSARDRCVVTFLNLNVTGKVMEAAKEALEKLFPAIQERVAAVDVKSPLQDIWDDLQKPIRLAESAWLLLQPDSVHLGPLRASRSTVSAELGLIATPRIVTGPKPAIPPRALPPLHPLHGGSNQGFALPIEGTLDYEVVSAELTRKLQKKSVRAAGGEFRLRSATLYGVAGGRVTLGVNFEGTAQGTIWLVGSPQYDPATGMITVPDLDFDASSAGLLVAGLAWVRADAIREFLRESAQVSAGALLGRLQEMAVKEMNRTLTRGVRLYATIGASEPTGLLVRPRDIVVRARAVGNARLEIGPEVFSKQPSVGSRE
jgi:hypothetical protein